MQNVICVADNAVEQPLASGFAQLFKRTQIHWSEVAADTASDNASTHCRLVEFVNPHQALDAYCNLVTTSDLYTACSAVSSMP